MARTRRAPEQRVIACRKCGSDVLTAAPVSLCSRCRAPERSCPGCGTLFSSPDSGTVYCSRSCWTKVLYVQRGQPTGRDHWNWKGGTSSYRGPGWRHIRDVARERDGWVCQDCGIGRDMARLHTHHLTPAAEWDRPGDANDLDNLVTLCGPCHRARHADPDEVRQAKDRAYRRAYYLAHREEAIAGATAWNREKRRRGHA